jgi:hypothetical protein
MINTRSDACHWSEAARGHWCETVAAANCVRWRWDLDAFYEKLGASKQKSLFFRAPKIWRRGIVRHWFRINDKKRNSLPIMILLHQAIGRRRQMKQPKSWVTHYDCLILSGCCGLSWKQQLNLRRIQRTLAAATSHKKTCLPTCASHHAPLRAPSCPITLCVYGSTSCGPLAATPWSPEQDSHMEEGGPKKNND